MIRHYAICSAAAIAKHKDVFHSHHGSHYIDLPDGRVLAIVHFSSESGEIAFASEPGVELLPDPVFEGARELDAEHVRALEHLKLEGKTVLHAAKAAAKVHPLMKLRSWM